MPNLCLSRRVGERLYVGPDLVITVVESNRGKTRFLLQAPATTPIYREELLPAGVDPAEYMRRETARLKGGAA